MEKKNLIWGYAGQILQYGAALIILPFLLRHLSAAEMGIWYIFMTISTFVSMVDMSLTPTLARSISYLLGGAGELKITGHDVEIKEKIDYAQIAATLKASKWLFGIFALILLALFASFGTIYLIHVAEPTSDLRSVLVAWAIFVVATCFDLYFKYLNGLLQGRMLMAGYYKLLAFSRLVFVAVTAFTVSEGAGLLGVSVGFLASTITGRFLGWYFNRNNYDNLHSHFKDVGPDTTSTKAKLPILWNGSSKIFLTAIGGFLILRSTTLISTSYLGLQTTASYALSLQVFMVITSVASVYLNNSIPHVARMRIQGNESNIHKMVGKGFVFSIGLYVLGSVIALCVGDEFLRLIHSNTALLPLPSLVFIAVMTLLEMNHSLSASIIISGNDVPFVGASIWSGIAVVVLAVIATTTTALGVWGLLLAQAIVQALYNNWKWPIYMAQSLKTSYLSLLRAGVCSFLRS